jgi:hypothetical protein
MVKVILVGLICLMAPFVLKAEERASKYRQECALTSQECKGNLPSTVTSVWCANDQRRDFGKMGSDVVHAMAVAAFYEKRMDRRLAAMNMLESYECKTR